MTDKWLDRPAFATQCGSSMNVTVSVTVDLYKNIVTSNIVPSLYDLLWL